MNDLILILFRPQYLEIEVKNPRTHIKEEKALYTDYEIALKVNNRLWSLKLIPVQDAKV